ncbi:7-cyano-7-deazaguanine synthase QueC [Aquifex aeolicus]|uniref:7-cyano-7-deazaguanine synthase n=1 Tax=Aquifex aeolicus (strain VF5) TaxID=224324 RepID=QUEC_AQUAE|nr:7-cyano-7-deazaguanine synthase QueC [Aquifex aeolicus]O67003.1 RecName: Full=7-cyano-7-deazaguanine synthase; AltName: Full=7-cyano-7-carbaguanine synthase; AltName: Full=PreQ(0) synthase; AltName: Full=Queuosine biosynthesis protein QueC [Aquifex aeolicus VF5]AAC06966.1 trans-regulatory protein ExsB [Aquifex aeolicus VF5]
MKKHDGIIVLLSGGMDSATLLWLAKREFKKVYAISFDYGQRHKVELKYAKELAKLAEVEDHFIVQVPFYTSLKGSALIDESVEVPKGEYPENEPPVTTVPMRNLIFLSIASAFADNLEVNYIGIGVHALDTPYPDCRPEFITAAEAAINAGSTFVAKKKERMHVYAPFLGMSKRDIALLGKELGVPFEKTYSCYMGTEPPCGECPTCIQREEALRGIL